MKLTFSTDAEINFTVWQLPDDELIAIKLCQDFGIMHKKFLSISIQKVK